MEPRQSYNRVFELLETHQKWFANSLPLIASENIPSPAVREALLSDFGNRYAEGWTGERVYAGCKYIDQVEQICIGKKEFGGTAGAVRGLNVEYLPFDTGEMNIDIDATEKKIKKLSDEDKKPTLAMLGGSVLPFPHPVKQLADTFQESDTRICFDAAHVAGLIAGTEFQDPLHEGADAMTASTHKTLPGPQGGLILSKPEHGEKIKKSTFPG